MLLIDKRLDFTSEVPIQTPRLGIANCRIAIDRWIKSKASENDVDRIIDLGIALEALVM